jgi:hypothetical protein
MTGSTNSQASPASWNRYAYAGDDPVGANDPEGLYKQDPNDPPGLPPDLNCGPEDFFRNDPVFCGSNGVPLGGSNVLAFRTNYWVDQFNQLSFNSSSGFFGAESGPLGRNLNVSMTTGEFSELFGILPVAVGAAGGSVVLGGGISIGGVIVTGGTVILVGLTAVAAYELWQYVHVRRLVTVRADCSVHQIGTPNHASVGLISATGQGTDYPSASAAAYSAAQASVSAQFGVGFHAQHCRYTALN